MKHMKHKIKLGIILGVEFVSIAVILILIFFAGKKTYTVTFDLNGGTLISGDIVQTVSQGQAATPPVVAKDGCYLHSWSGSYRQVTRDMVVEAVWEWNTSIGFNYTSAEDSDYCEIESSFEYLVGDVYVGVYHNNKKVLGIKDNAFCNRDGITNIHMLDGILHIGDNAFSECDSLISVELPGTLKTIGKNAFKNCVSLERVVFPDNLEVIPEGTFAGCVSLREIVIPSSVKRIEAGAFDGCTSLERIIFTTDEETVEVEIEGDESEITTELVTVYKGIESLGVGVFHNCPALIEVVLPATLTDIDELAFNNAELIIYTPVKEEEKPEGWVENWCGASTVVWESEGPDTEEPETDTEE